MSPGFECQRNGDRARAGSYINYAARAQNHRGFDNVLSLRARDQDVRSDAEVAAVELLNPGDLLRRLALEALMQVAAVVDPPDLAEFFVRMGIGPCAFTSNGVCQ